MIDVKNSLIINNVVMAEYITEAKLGFMKTWGEDTGFVTMTNKFVGTYKGAVPKITLKYGKSLTKTQLQYLYNNILKYEIVTITFKDLGGNSHTMQFHDGDVIIGYKGLNKHDAFTHEYVGNEAL